MNFTNLAISTWAHQKSHAPFFFTALIPSLSGILWLEILCTLKPFRISLRKNRREGIHGVSSLHDARYIWELSKKWVKPMGTETEREKKQFRESLIMSWLEMPRLRFHAPAPTAKLYQKANSTSLVPCEIISNSRYLMLIEMDICYRGYIEGLFQRSNYEVHLTQRRTRGSPLSEIVFSR